MQQEHVIDRDLILANSNVLSAAAVLVILGLMVVPVPPVMLDLMLTFSIAFSLLDTLDPSPRKPPAASATARARTSIEPASCSIWPRNSRTTSLPIITNHSRIR